MTDQGAIDHDFEEGEQSYEERVEGALEGIQTEPVAGGIVVDIVTRQLLFVHEKVAPDLATYYDEEGFDLATYGPHPWLPVTFDDAAFECVYLSDVSLEKLGDWGDVKTYDFPAGRLAPVPVHMAWDGQEVGDV